MSNLLSNKSKLALVGILAAALIFFAFGVPTAGAFTKSEIDGICVVFNCTSTQRSALEALATDSGETSDTTLGAYPGLLKKGSKGDAVKSMQQVLLDLDYDLGSYGADGSFGSMTDAAVRAYQANKSLTVDGLVGRLTWSSLQSVSGTTPDDTTPPVVTGQVTVALATDTPASGVLVSDDSTGVMHNAAPMVKLVFTNGNSSEVKVNTLKFTRTGVSVDGDVNNLFLYDGDTKLAEMNSVSTKVFTFNNSSGLFAIPANGSKTITVGVNIATGLSGTKTIGFQLPATTDVTLSGGTVGGTFPISGNAMSIAAVTDLGYINLTSTTTFPATIDPSDTPKELWRFTATANSQKMQVKKIMMTMVGTIATSDITDLKLEVGGVQVGSTAQIDSSAKTLTFDLSSAPYEILSGQNKIFVLMGKVVKGTGRAFKFTIRSTADFVSFDTNYGVNTTPQSGGAALTVVDPDASGDGTNINNGTLTISRSASSPSGNVPSAGLDVPLAKFDYKANGEDIKVSYVRVTVNRESTDETMDDGKLYYNGSQVGTTDDSVADETAEVFSLGNSVIIPAASTGVFEYRANVRTAAGVATAAGQTIVVSLGAGTTDATGQTSLTNVATSASTALTLTVQTGTTTGTKNTSMADYTTVTPTGVVGSTNVKVSSLIITAGAGEAVNLTQVVVGDDGDETTSDFGDNFQNLVPKDASGTVLATMQGTLSGNAGIDYTFSLSPSINISAGGQYVINFYADILTGAAGFAANGQPGLEFVNMSATGVTTGTNAYPTATVANLQNVVVAANGTLTIAANASTPVASQFVMGDTDQTFAILDFAAGSSEDMNVSAITITDTSSFSGSLNNIKLYDGSTLLGTISSFSASDTAAFNFATPWTIPRSTTKQLTIKASVNAFGNAVAGGSHTVNLANNGNITTIGASSGVGITETVSSATGNAVTTYRTKPTIDKAGTSPSGSTVVGANTNVLEFNVSANSMYNVMVNTVAITISGSANMTSTGNANLYKSTDLVNALASEAYDIITADNVGSTTTLVDDTSTDVTGIPAGATVRIYDTSAGGYMAAGAVKIVSITAAGTVTYTPATVATAATDILYYRPLQPGTGKLFFGAQSTLTTANAANTDTTVTVTSTDGFSVGDTVSLAGYNSTGIACTGTGAITGITSATVLAVSGGITVTCASGTATIVYNYLSGTPSQAITNGQNSAAIAYTGLINSGNGQPVTAGTTTTFVVKGDSTSTGTSGTTATLRADIAAVGDFNWDDYGHYGVTTVTKNIPVTGGTLTFTY